MAVPSYRRHINKHIELIDEARKLRDVFFERIAHICNRLEIEWIHVKDITNLFWKKTFNYILIKSLKSYTITLEAEKIKIYSKQDLIKIENKYKTIKAIYYEISQAFNAIVNCFSYNNKIFKAHSAKVLADLINCQYKRIDNILKSNKKKFNI